MSIDIFVRALEGGVKLPRECYEELLAASTYFHGGTPVGYIQRRRHGSTVFVSVRRLMAREELFQRRLSSSNYCR